MKYLISLPENTIESFHNLASVDKEHFFCASDPDGVKVGSGGGTAWLMMKAWEQSSFESFDEWLAHEKKIIIHGGGQSRRLPSYAAMGKLLLPIPVLRWERGQHLNQTLLDLQRPLLERIQHASGENKYTLIASGDVLITSSAVLPEIPDADIICFGLCVEPELASNHGVFITNSNNPESLDHMLQKPGKEILRTMARDTYFYIDVGIWLLSEKAINLLMKKSGWDLKQTDFFNGTPDYYDMYGSFGLSMGENPTQPDADFSDLNVMVLQVPEGEFYHFGTSREIISSSLALQNVVKDPRDIWTKNVKPHPAIFIQNSNVDIPINEDHANLWIENSSISSGWSLEGDQLITGVPMNKWSLTLPSGFCLDMAPAGNDFLVRLYGIGDSFRGKLNDSSTTWMNQSFNNWLDLRGLSLSDCGLGGESDIFEAPLFPILPNSLELEKVIQWLINPKIVEGKRLWLNAKRLSASAIPALINLDLLEKQRRSYRALNWTQVASNFEKSVFFQIDLDHAASDFATEGLSVPEVLQTIDDPLQETHFSMFQARVNKYKGKNYRNPKDHAFEVLQNSILGASIKKKVHPVKNVFDDQIVWSRSPVRIDMAGGWTDTPPYSVLTGGNVVNISLELNGQPPLQAFIRPHGNYEIILRSIDLGEREIVSSFEDLLEYTTVGSPFAIPKAALCLAGFHPMFSDLSNPGLKEQLKDFGCGLEISFLAAIPKGSGMGTSSILAATILGAISDFCSLDWDQFEICNRTLALEQLLTTGGGWQDQYGGVIPGIKLLQTERGWDQTPKIRWLPDRLFTEPEYHSSMLLYYTGITRVAKNLLEEIVEGMFLNERDRLEVLKEMKSHTLDTWETIQLGDFTAFGKRVKRSWVLNKRLDADTTSPQIESIISLIDDLCLGYKLPGAGGGGYLYIIAKDPVAAQIVKRRLEDNPPNSKARFVQMDISNKGLQISRS